MPITMKRKLETKSLAFDINETEPIICYAATMISSDGLWHKENPLYYSLPLFLVQLLLVLVITRLFVYILKPIRQPRVISELMVSPFTIFYCESNQSFTSYLMLRCYMHACV